MAREQPLAEQRFVFWATLLGGCLFVVGDWWSSGRLAQLGWVGSTMPDSLWLALPFFVCFGFAAIGTVYLMVNDTRYAVWTLAFWLLLGSLSAWVAWATKSDQEGMVEATKKSAVMLVVPAIAAFLRKVRAAEAPRRRS